MFAYLVLILAALSRLLPHFLHGVGLNFTAVGGGLLFFGSRRSRREALAATGVLALTDVYLTRCVYGSPFHVTEYAMTWAWYAAVCLLASGMLRQVTAVRASLAVLASASSFFMLSNLEVWSASGMYPHTPMGLAVCYGAGLPFYGNDLLSTGLTAAVLFGVPVVAERFVNLWEEAAGGRNLLR